MGLLATYHPIRGEADRSDPLATLAPRQLTPRARNESGRAGLLDSRVPQSDAAVLAGACDQPRRGAVRDGVYVLLMSGQSCRLLPVRMCIGLVDTWYLCFGVSPGAGPGQLI